MGIYIFNADLLDSLLTVDAARQDSSHDFGKNIIPAALEERAVYAYAFQDVRTKAQAYWRDVGTLDAYYEANMELVHVRPELNIYDDEWPIWTYQLQRPPAKFVLDDQATGRVGTAINSMVSAGCIISGASVRESLLFSDVRVEECSTVERSVLLPRVSIGRGCVIRRAILDEGCVVPDDMQIGVDAYTDASRFEVTEKGVVLVTPRMLQALA
jgi:glucose-1-phosphate adenylyltransferase